MNRYVFGAIALALSGVLGSLVQADVSASLQLAPVSYTHLTLPTTPYV